MRKLSIIFGLFTVLILFGCSVNLQTTTTTTQQITTTSQLTTTTQQTTTTDTGNISESMDLEIDYIDVGQADSILVNLPNGEHLLIDAGTNDAGPTVVSFINSKNITTLDYVVGTHPHEDHIGGIDNVVDTFNIGKIYLPNITATTATYVDMMTAINNKHLTVTQAKAGVTLFDEQYDNKTLKAVMLSPIDTSYAEVNNYSAVIRLTYGDTSYLFTGDAQDVVENELINSPVDLHANVLKVGHHGSSTSSTQAFLDAVDPQIGVISVGVGNVYGHPTPSTIDRLNANNIDIYRTDQDGTVSVKSNGTDILVNTANGTSTMYLDINGNHDNPVVINEISPAPATGNEWVELYNKTDASVDISGYTIGNGNTSQTIPTNTTIDANGYFVYQLTTASLNNSGDEVNLYQSNGTLIDSFTYGNTNSDESWYRIFDGGRWSAEATTDSTPNATNVVTAPIVDVPVTVVVNEFLPAPKTVFSNEWVELYNTTSEEINLSGYQIDDIDGGSNPYTIPEGVTIPAYGYYVYDCTGSVFNNGGDDVRLINPKGTVIDKFSYATTGYDVAWYRVSDGGVWSDTPTATPTKGVTNSPDDANS